MDLQQLLHDLFNEVNLEKRRYIPDKLAKLGDWQSTKPLGEIITSQDQPLIMRNEAVESLGKQGDPAAIPYLINVLDDADEDIRRTAVWSLGQIGTAEAVDPVFSMTSDPSVEVRRWVAKSAGRIRADAVLDKLEHYLQSIDLTEDRVVADILRAVTSQIQRLKNSQQSFWTRQCYEILNSTTALYVKQAAILLLNQIYAQGVTPESDQLRSVFETLPENDPLVRPHIFTGLAYAGDVEFLRLYLDQPIAITSLGIAGADQLLYEQLQTQNNELLSACLEGFSYLETYPDLSPYYDHENSNVRAQALQLHALHHLPIQRLHTAFTAGDSKYKILELYRFYGSQAISVLKETALHDEKVARQYAVYSLISDECISTADTSQVAAILQEVAHHDMIWHIRRDARIGLERLGISLISR